MSTPYFTENRFSVVCTLVLLLALVLLVLMGLGVFRLYFDFAVTAGGQAGGQVFALKIYGGNAFNLFQAEPFGAAFWAIRLLGLGLVLVLPWCRTSAAIALGVFAAVIIELIYRGSEHALPVPKAFELLIVLVLLGLHGLLSAWAMVRNRTRVAGLLSQYVPPELANRYSHDPKALALCGEEREVSVLFCDIVDFTSTSEELEPQALASWLNEFFTLVGRVVVRHHGAVDKYMGDSVMAVWGASAPSETHAYDALAAALDIQREIQLLDAQMQANGRPALQVGIGVSTGLANVGVLGSQWRRDYTVVGDPVNVAKRLEGQTRRCNVPIIAAEQTAAGLPALLFRELGTIKVKGRRRHVAIYEPLGQREAADAAQLARLAMHEQALQAWRNDDRTQARKLFAQLRESWGPAQIYDGYLDSGESGPLVRNADSDGATDSGVRH